MNIPDVVRQLLALEGGKQEALANKLGVQQPTVSRWIKGSEPTGRTRDKLLELARSKGLLDQSSLPLILTTEGMSSATPPRTLSDFSEFARDLPVHEGALCGEDGAFEFENQAADQAPRPPRLANVKEAYALLIRGDSMSPWKEQGDMVYVHPRLPVRASDYVVIQLKPKHQGDPNPAYVKRLLGENTKEIRVQQFHPQKTLVFPRSKIFSVHRIMKPEELLGL